jgi:hypothetical protein
MSFGPCSKNLAENRFWSLSAWGAAVAFQFCARGPAFTNGLRTALAEKLTPGGCDMVTARSDKRKLPVKAHFCDDHHIVKAKPAVWVYPSKWANGRVPCLLPLYLWKHLR